MARLLREEQRRNKQSLLAQKKDFEKKLAKLKAGHVRLTRRLVQSYKSKSLREKMAAEERARQERVRFDQEYLRLKTAYQHSLAQIKQACSRQDALILDEFKASVIASIDASKSQIVEIAESTRVQLAEMRQWMEQVLPGVVLEHANNFNDQSKNVEVNTERILNAIDKRDQQIQLALERIKGLESRLALKQTRTLWKRVRRDAAVEPYKEESSADPEQEILDIIREIAKERNRMNGAGDKDSLNHLADSFGSRMSTKLSH